MFRKYSLAAGVIAAILFLVLVGDGARLITDYLWFQSLGYTSIFTTILFTDLGLRILVGLFFFIFLFINLLFTRRVILEYSSVAYERRAEHNVISIEFPQWKEFLNKRVLTWLFFVVSVVLAYMFSLAVAGDWQVLQKFLHATPFGSTDPLFGKDIGFYVFSLPFYLFLYNILFWAGILVVLLVAAAYFLANPFRGLTSIFSCGSARVHLSVLAALVLALKAWGYQLQQYLLLYSPGGAVFGAGYTDVNANLLALKVLFVLAVIAAIAVLVNVVLRRTSVLIYAVGGLIAVSLILGAIYPAMVQKFVVEPNEFNKEKPYIEHNIAFTRAAYNLDEIETKPFPSGRVIGWDEVENNEDTVKNIRLWDWEPLKSTYSQMQEMRLYYEFKDIDIDRYTIDGVQRQVMLAAREFDQSKLSEQAKTWINTRLVYTHGYGVAMSPVNEVAPDGLPEFFFKDIPPRTDTDLKLERNEIYYGESTDQYVIVNTKAKEFDYPKGDQNVYTTYEGTSGVKLGSVLKRLLFAISLGDYRLVLASDVNAGSQILYYRNIHDRVPKIAPFLEYDGDPYIVVSNGKLYWLWDAYTTTDMYPYSEPFAGRTNYIRNSVKVVVDAYTGNVSFYVADTNDPIVKTWSKIFPGVFQDLEAMPRDLVEHIRYPQDLFEIQARMYTLYHMQDPQVFFTKEDKWNLPTEIYAGNEQRMEPYYVIIRLPGEGRPEFVLITSFTPQNKKNMIAWMAARCDGENYGKILVFQMPKQSLVYGPMQIEARINQDTTISQQLTLWDQRGSRVIRGNLLVIPVEDSLLYVEPIYLQAEQSKMPELRRVILVHGDKIVMEPTLERALSALFGERDQDSPEQTEPPEVPGTPVQGRTIKELIKNANRYYEEAQERLREGNWSAYGQALDDLQKTLEELSKMVEE
ncbi:MAG: UPF0182 family protein [Peptococcaceae bacterium]|nr:UPF0182 family protein [Peptococcaceae bacterium]